MEGNISLPVRYSYLSILPDDNVDSLTAFQLIYYCNFLSLILSSIAMTILYVLWKIVAYN